MKRTRDLNRYLTKRYQNKQRRLYNLYWDDIREITPSCNGYMRKHSWKDCGNSRCCMCGNPRRVGWLNNFDKLTMQEKRSSYCLDEQLNEYYASF